MATSNYIKALLKGEGAGRHWRTWPEDSTSIICLFSLHQDLFAGDPEQISYIKENLEMLIETSWEINVRFHLKRHGGIFSENSLLIMTGQRSRPCWGNIPWAVTKVPWTEMFLKLIFGGTRLSSLVEFPSSSMVRWREAQENLPLHSVDKTLKLGQLIQAVRQMQKIQESFSLDVSMWAK